MNTCILLFDDDMSYGKILQRQGRKLGLKVVHCSNMDDFCLKALEGNYDVALIDYNLGAFKGDDVARVIEQKPTYLISGDATLAGRQATWPNGIRGFFAKSNDTSRLLTDTIAAATALNS